MPQTRHLERHSSGSQALRDIVIGMSDGLTVPFALGAGLSGATANSHIVVTALLAETVAGSIAMGLGGYLAAQSDAEHCAVVTLAALFVWPFYVRACPRSGLQTLLIGGLAAGAAFGIAKLISQE